MHRTIALLMTFALIPTAAAGWIEATDDAEGTFIVMSGTGNATCTDTYDGCFLTVSGGGNATDPRGPAVSVLGNATGAYAVSVAGEAVGDENNGGAISVLGNASAAIPLSAAGECRDGGFDRPCFAAAPDGPASAFWLGVAVAGDADAVIAASLLGNATGLGAVSGTGTADGFGGAVAIGGDASSRWGTAVSGLGNATGCRDWSDCAAVSLLGDSDGGTAITLAGHADGRFVEFSACDTLTAHGRPEACRENLPPV